MPRPAKSSDAPPSVNATGNPIMRNPNRPTNIRMARISPMRALLTGVPLLQLDVLAAEHLHRADRRREALQHEQHAEHRDEGLQHEDELQPVGGLRLLPQAP